MTLLTKKQFLESDDRTYKNIELPELKGEVKIRSFSGKDELEFESIRHEKNSSELVFWMIMKGCVDENNNPMFDEQDLEGIKKKSSITIKKLFDEILDLNNINTPQIEEEAKNS